jgi:hypothetical protein
MKWRYLLLDLAESDNLSVLKNQDVLEQEVTHPLPYSPTNNQQATTNNQQHEIPRMRKRGMTLSSR